jgi:glutamate-ammonia-ligase adenylyltransferase
VQVFSLFKANPHLLELIVEICAVAPRLAGHLGRNPAVLDALLGQEFFEPLGDAAALAADLETWLARESDYERVLDAARRWAREQHFRAGVQVLRGLADAAEAGAAFSAIAEACLDALMPRVIDEFAARHGPPPGEGLAIVGMGKLGTREMTAGSDLDLIVVYDPGQAEESEGPKPLSVLAYYRRLTQALVSALTAPTAEGRLYEVDMRLRPSGRAGPVATSLSGFRSYQREKAWVWEHLALTRARVVCGPEPIRRAVEDTIAEVLAGRAGRPEVMEEARGMHARVAEAHAGDRKRLWSLKHAAGGLMEIEFVAQTGLVAAGLGAGHGAAEALPALAEAGWLSAGEADALGRALALMQALQQLERAALDTPFDPETAGQGLRKAFARAGGVETFAELETRLEERQREAAAICAAVLGR